MKKIKKKLIIAMLSIVFVFSGAMSIFTTNSTIANAEEDTSAEPMFFVNGAQASNLDKPINEGITYYGKPLLFLRFVVCVDPSVIDSVGFDIIKGNESDIDAYRSFYLEDQNAEYNVIEVGSDMGNGYYAVPCIVYCRNYAAINTDVQIEANGYVLNESTGLLNGFKTVESSTRSILDIWRAIDSNDAYYDNDFSEKSEGLARSFVNAYDDGFLESAMSGLYTLMSDDGTVGSGDFGLENSTKLIFRIPDSDHFYHGMSLHITIGSSAGAEINFGIDNDGLSFDSWLNENGDKIPDSDIATFISSTFQFVSFERLDNLGNTKYDVYFRMKDLTKINEYIPSGMTNFEFVISWESDAPETIVNSFEPLVVYASAVPVYDEYNNALVAEKQAVNDQLIETQAQINTLENTIYNKELQIIELNNQITELNNQIATFQGEIDSLNDQINTLNTQISSLQTQLSNKEAALNQANQTISQKTNELAALQTEYDNYKIEVANKYKEYEDEIDSLTKANGSLDTAVKDLQAVYDAYKATAEKTISDKETEITNLNLAIAQLDADKKTLQNQIQNLNTTISTHETTIQTKNDLIATKENEITNLNTTLNSYSELITDLNDEITFLETENEKLKKEYDSVLDSANKDSATLLDENAKLTSQNSELTAQLKQLEAELEQLRQDEKEKEEDDSIFSASCNGCTSSIMGGGISLAVSVVLVAGAILITKARKLKNEDA